MQDKPIVGLYLDTRRLLGNGKFPVKVRVTWQIIVNGKTSYVPKYFTTHQSVSQDDYNMLITGKSRGLLREVQDKVFAARAKAENIIEDNKRITINLFVLQYSGKVISTGNVHNLFQEIIDTKFSEDKIGTRDFYIDAQRSFEVYATKFLELHMIDKKWCEAYVAASAKEGNSINTSGAYLRALRRVFNIAIDRKIISIDQYPFGRKGYSIRKKRVKKKPIPSEIKDKIVAFTPRSLQEAEALDFCIFSYLCNGMNFADIAHLQVNNFRGDHFVFIRRKTRDTVIEQKEIRVPINKAIRDIIKRRGGRKPYVFGILKPDMSAEEMDLTIMQWRKTTNKYLRAIAKAIGYEERVSTAVLRHTFTSILINAGVPITKVKDSLGHTTVTTTQDYAEDLGLDEARKYQDYL